jgi:hypothetical protein
MNFVVLSRRLKALSHEFVFSISAEAAFVRTSVSVPEGAFLWNSSFYLGG